VAKSTEQFDGPGVQEVNFVADVHLIQILGEQLIGSEKVGVLELIKNAYDAGAPRCDVWIEKVPGLPYAEPSAPEVEKLLGPVISIIDNGKGMDERTLKYGWLRPATRLKTNVKILLKEQRRRADEEGTRAEYERLVKSLKQSNGGRLPLGEKGVGRFATHRLGRYLILKTKEKNSAYEWMLRIDWDDFEPRTDDPVDLHKVPIKLTRQELTRDYGKTDSGTEIRIYGGREGFDWTEEKIVDVGRAISALRSPAPESQPSGFSVYFHCPQLSNVDFNVPTNSVPAPFECTALVDENGLADIEIILTPPPSLPTPISPKRWIDSIDLRQKAPKYWRNGAGNRAPLCGPFSVSLKLWIRRKEWIEYADWKEFTGYLDEFGGIGIYRDGLSILPPQISSKDDWLRLSNRHIQKASNVSYYQMWGSVDLQQELTLNLVDRTSREGMIETRPLADLRELVRGIVFEVERRVQETRDEYKELGSIPLQSIPLLKARVSKIASLLGRIEAAYDFSSDSLKINELLDASNPQEEIGRLAGSAESLQSDYEGLEEQVDGLLQAAGYGISISVALHEIEKTTSNLYHGLAGLVKRVSTLSASLENEGERLREVSKSLLNELKRIAPLRVTRLEKARSFGIRDAILAAIGAFRISWESEGVGFVLPPKPDDFTVFGSFGACSQVFANLFDNSTYWLSGLEPSRRRLAVSLRPDDHLVIVADDGPGISAAVRPHLFQPFYSLKSPPSGLGLYICQYYMRQMGGSIRESFESERIPGYQGASFTVSFPQKRSDA